MKRFPFYLFCLGLITVFSACQSEGSYVPNTNLVLMVVADKDYFDPEYELPRKSLEQRGYEVRVASISGGTAQGLNGGSVQTDLRVAEVNHADYRAIMLVGGYGAESMYGNQALIRLVQDFFQAGKVLGAQCYSPIVLAQAGVLENVPATCWGTQAEILESYGVTYTGQITEVHGRILTGISGTPTNVNAFTDEYLKLLEGQGRFTGGSTGKEIAIPAVTTTPVDESTLEFSEDHTSFKFYHAGNLRTGQVHIPPTLAGNNQASLVIGIHGMNSRGIEFQFNGFDRLADKFNFIMVYPDGLEGQWETDPGTKGVNDDLGFFKRLIDFFIAEFNIDPGRIYVTGHSLGGFMAYRLAYELSGKITAIAPMAGVFVKPRNDLSPKELSVLHIHAANDTVVPLAGFPGYSYSIPQTLEFWRNLNRTGAAHKIAVSDGISITSWSAGSSGHDVVYVEYGEGGHAWLSGGTEFIADFFYNRPGRGARILFDSMRFSPLRFDTSPLIIKPIIETSKEIRSIELLVNGLPVDQTEIPPYEFEYKPELYKNYHIDIKAVLTDGTTIVSSNDLDFAVVPPNIAKDSWVTTSDNESPGLTGKNAVDGNMNTRWSSGQDDDQFIIIDLGAIQQVSGVTLVWESAFGSEYRIDLSHDKLEWGTVYLENEGRGGKEIIRFEPQQARYVRLQGIRRATNWRYSLWEILVHS